MSIIVYNSSNIFEVFRDIDYTILHNVLLLSKDTVLHDYSIAVLWPSVLEEYFQKYEPAHISRFQMNLRHNLGTVLFT